MAQALTQEEFMALVGQELDASEWFQITQEAINQFADVTHDHQFIHIDEEAAKNTPFGGTIAHGFLTLSMLSHLCEAATPVPDNVVMGINYGFDKVRFLTPVRAGKKVRSHSKVLSIQEKPGNRLLLTQEISVEIEGEENPALVAHWLTMYVCG